MDLDGIQMLSPLLLQGRGCISDYYKEQISYDVCSFFFNVL